MFAMLTVACQKQPKPDITEMNPNDIAYNQYVHETLPDDLLKRIKATTDVFEVIDGVSYEEAVDLYKRDLHPEDNLIIWEEMVRVFKTFCPSQCSSLDKKKEVYRAVLITSMFPKNEVFEKTQPHILTESEMQKLIAMYQLEPQPIEVFQQ